MRTRLLTLWVLALIATAALAASEASVRLVNSQFLIHIKNRGFYSLTINPFLIVILLFMTLATLSTLFAPFRRFVYMILTKVRKQLGLIILLTSLSLSLTMFVGTLTTVPGVLLLLSVILLVTLSLAPRRWRLQITRSAWEFIVKLQGLSDLQIAGLFVLAITPVLAGIGLLFYQDVPMSGDAGSSLFQAVLLSQGKFRLNPDFPQFYNATAILWNYGVCSMYPPGHSMMLALGEFFHMAWLIGPLLGALTVAMVFLIGSNWFGRSTGLLAALLLAVSPHFLAMSPSYFSHSTAAFWLTATLYTGLVISEMRPSMASGFSTGFCAAMTFLSRPLTAFTMGLPIGLDFLCQSIRQKQHRQILGACIALLCMATFFFYYNFQTTGDFFLSGYQAAGANHRLGFGGITNHTPELGFYNTLNNLWEYGRWAPGVFPSVYLLLAIWLVVGPFSRKELVLASMWLLLPASYFFYYWQDLSLGPRFMYEAAIPTALLSARGTKTFVDNLCKGLGRSDSHFKHHLFAYVALAFIVSAIPISYYRLPHVQGYSPNVTFMQWRRNFTHDPNAVVFVKDERLSIATAETARHPEGPLFLQHQGEEENRKYMQAHPDKVYYDEQGNRLHL